MATKIKWTDDTWNPVWGCKANCDYCYAKGIAKRFAEPMIRAENEYKNFDPEIAELFFDEKIEKIKAFDPYFFKHKMFFKKFPKQPKKIFIGSMSDIAFWKDDWVELLLQEIKQYPQHTFQLLTKFPKVYQKDIFASFPKNVWFGATVTKTDELEKMIDLLHINAPLDRIRYVNFEPLLENIPTKTLFGAGLVDWVIIGAMSGNNKPRTKTEWIGNIVAQAKRYNKPVFVKQIEINGKIETDIKKFPKDLQYQEFPNCI
jgi:protein gp37